MYIPCPFSDFHVSTFYFIFSLTVLVPCNCVCRLDGSFSTVSLLFKYFFFGCPLISHQGLAALSPFPQSLSRPSSHRIKPTQTFHSHNCNHRLPSTSPDNVLTAHSIRKSHSSRVPMYPSFTGLSILIFLHSLSCPMFDTRIEGLARCRHCIWVIYPYVEHLC